MPHLKAFKSLTSRSPLYEFLSFNTRSSTRRLASSLPPSTPTPQTPPNPSTTTKVQSRTRQRLDRWIARSPKFFKPSLTALRDAPASYIISFAILHEITAVVPLAGLAGTFHYYHWLPPYFAEGKWVLEGVEKFGRYFRKKGWIQERDEKRLEQQVKSGNAQEVEKQSGKGREKISNMWNRGEDMGRWIVEIATAWAVVKVLLPVRILFSVWWAPGFARLTMIPLTRWMGSRLKRVKP